MNLLAGIQAVTFDVGGTLIEPWPSVGQVYAEVAARHGLPSPSPAVLDRNFAAAWQTRGEFNYSKAAWFGLVRRTFATEAGTLPATFLEAVYDRFADPAVWRIYADVLPALEGLAAREIDLGVISNWDERLRPLLADLKLERYFTVVVVSCEVGFTKPSPVIFEQALRALGLPGQAVLHVGDSPHEDVAGARATGLRAVRLDRRGAGGGGGLGSLLELSG
ncbi:MAG: HAD-IA family hydrolase [Verrucomicrobia bacterium]|nr:HAD-IA family hydrolase [Verrucomicrobiota bacterium]